MSESSGNSPCVMHDITWWADTDGGMDGAQAGSRYRYSWRDQHAGMIRRGWWPVILSAYMSRAYLPGDPGGGNIRVDIGCGPKTSMPAQLGPRDPYIRLTFASLTSNTGWSVGGIPTIGGFPIPSWQQLPMDIFAVAEPNQAPAPYLVHISWSWRPVGKTSA